MKTWPEGDLTWATTSKPDSHAVRYVMEVLDAYGCTPESRKRVAQLVVRICRETKASNKRVARELAACWYKISWASDRAIISAALTHRDLPLDVRQQLKFHQFMTEMFTQEEQT